MLVDSLQCGQNAGRDLVDRPLAWNLPVTRRARIALRGPFRIVVDQRPGLLLVDLEPLPDRLFAVVLALHQRLAGRVVLPGDLGRTERDVIVPARSRVHAAPGETPDDLFVVDIDLEDEVE